MNYKPVVAEKQSNGSVGEEEKKDDEDPENEDNEDNVVDKNIVYRGADDPNMPNLEEIVYSNDDEDDGKKDGMTHLDTNIPMDVKSVFLYGKIEEEVYICQPLGYEDLEFTDRVYKVEKALYCLHQAPRAWEMCIEFEKMMHKKFQISSMEELTFFLGLQVT
nr:ribonuclease H-like domain-containing protein [Tanacetum cinerariifolium]GFA03787.1 ribonuclease H-like domain-containing protein [Tanacetum cinerariifolium]